MPWFTADAANLLHSPWQDAEYERALRVDRERAASAEAAAASAAEARLRSDASRGKALAAALRSALPAPADGTACCALRVDVPGTELRALEFRMRSDAPCAALYAAVRVQLLQHAMGDEHHELATLQALVRPLLLCEATRKADPALMLTLFLARRRMQPPRRAACC